MRLTTAPEKRHSVLFGKLTLACRHCWQATTRGRLLRLLVSPALKMPASDMRVRESLVVLGASGLP